MGGHPGSPQPPPLSPAKGRPMMHVDEEVLAPVRARYGKPAVVEWEGEITAQEFAIATYDPARTHDVTLFILNGPRFDARGRALPVRAAGQRLALIRKPMFPPDVWRPPGGGVKPGEDFVAAVEREGLEETGLRIELERYLVDMRARFLHEGPLEWRTHVFLARTADDEIAPLD